MDLTRIIQRELQSRVNDGEPGAALAVSLNGHLIFAGGRGRASLHSDALLTEQSAFDSGSIAKVVTGLAVALLEADGRITLDDRITTYLPELPSHANEIRIRHLLSHESGLFNYFTAMYYMAGWHELAPPSPDDVYQTVCRTPRIGSEPGVRYEYSDTNYFLLARIISRISGRSFGEFVRENITGPLMMSDSYFTDDSSRSSRVEGHVDYPSVLDSPFRHRSQTPAGQLHPVSLGYTHVGAEGFRTSAMDLLRLGEHVLNPVLVAEDVMNCRILAAPRARPDGFGYGYGLNIGAASGRRFIGHNGAIFGFTGSLSILPENGLVVACLTNRHDLGSWEIRDTILDALGLALGRTRTPTPIEISSGGIDSGFYLDPVGANYAQVERSGKGVLIGVNGAEWVPVVERPSPGESPHTVHVWNGDHPIEFHEFVDKDLVNAEEYMGTYSCGPLATAFRVEPVAGGVRLTNTDKGRPSMDLDYAATIRDFFWSQDPHPGISQIQFLRENGRVRSVIYRDYDGDGREAFIFEKQS